MSSGAIAPMCMSAAWLFSSVPWYITGSSDMDDRGISSVVVLVSTAAGSPSRSSGTQLALGVECENSAQVYHVL